MTRVHDMGGRFGDGTINPREPDAVFDVDWHGRALALTLAAGALGKWNLDISRHARECLAPQDYARFGYYEKWLAGLADLLVDNGVLTKEELRTLTPTPNSELIDRKMLAENVARILASGGPADRPSQVAIKLKPDPSGIHWWMGATPDYQTMRAGNQVGLLHIMGRISCQIVTPTV